MALALAVHGFVTGFGAVEIAGIGVTLLLGSLARLDPQGSMTGKVVVLLAASGVMLVVVDVLVLFALDSAVRPPPLRGFYASDDELGFRLAPNASMVYRDRVIGSASYTTNELGHRDAMPSGSGENRVLLLGDSMTFGELLDDDETIDRAVEVFSGQRFDAYNLGVPGYGAEAAAVTLARNEIPAKSAIYFFYPNDLRNDGLATQRNRVWKGFLVTGEDAQGNQLSEEELDARVARGLEAPPLWLDVLRLRHLLRAVNVASRAPAAVGFQELPTDDSGPMGYREENLEIVIAHTQVMHELAQEKGLDFAVVPIPSMAETSEGERYDLVDRYIERLRALDIAVLDAYENYDTEDYFAHDGHFDASGAQKTAQVVIDWLERRTLMNTARTSE